MKNNYNKFIDVCFMQQKFFFYSGFLIYKENIENKYFKFNKKYHKIICNYLY
jgi:hypothetical protein